MHLCLVHDLFHKDRIPRVLPKEMNSVIIKLRKTRNKEECVRKAYHILSRRYRGYRILTYLKLLRIFDNVDEIWKRQGFLHCHHCTYLMRILLVRSGKFKDSDIEIKKTLVWYVSPHQYLRIRIKKKEYLNIDLWGKFYGIKFGDYAHGFH